MAGRLRWGRLTILRDDLDFGTLSRPSLVAGSPIVAPMCGRRARPGGGCVSFDCRRSADDNFDRGVL